jgi:hypothetical protein
MNHALETNKLFPYIAWTFVILFAFLTYALAAHLHAELAAIDAETNNLEAQVHAQ